MTVDDVNEENYQQWVSDAEEGDPICCGFPMCSKHNVLIAGLGCKICNDN